VIFDDQIFFMHIITWLLAHAISILTLVLVVATVFLAYYTCKLVDEARKSRKAQIQPIMIAYLERAETSPTYMFIIVKNIGKGIAYNLSFDVQKDIRKYQGSMLLNERGLFKNGMKYFPPEYSMKYFFIDTVDQHEQKMNEELILVAKYQSYFQKNTTAFVEDTFHLKLKELQMSGKISPSDTYIGSIDETLKEIKKCLKENNSTRFP